jgi:hypothetical protein
MITAVCTHWGVEEWPAQAMALAPMVESREIGQVIVAEVESRGLRDPELPKALAAVVAYIEIAEPVSVAVALNRAIEAAQGDWILTLSGDVLPVPGSANAMQAWLTGNPGAAMVGGDYWFGEVGQLAHATEQVDGILTAQRAGLALNQYGLTRRSLWDQVRYDESGPFARPGWGGEDNDLGCQIRAAGLTIWMIQQVATPRGPAEFRYVHAGLHGSIRKLQRLGIDTAKERAARLSYLAERWGSHPLDGHRWSWEREDEYVGPGRYSLRAVDELQTARSKEGMDLKVAPTIWQGYRKEP